MNRKLPQNFASQKFYYIIFLIGMLSLVFSVNTVNGQSIGDWRSAGNGNWTSLSSWQYYSATGWATPTAAQGYPGQYASSGAVTILATHTITLGYGNPTPITTLPMGTITITGTLLLAGDNSNNPSPKFELDTHWVYVTPNVGHITFNNKANLWIASSVDPGTAILTVNKSAGYSSIIGDCSHNQDINFGPDAVSYCAGGKLTFDDLMTGGGSLNAVIAPVSPVCQGGTINLSGSYTGSPGTGVTYKWYTVDSSGNATQFATGPTASISNALTSYTIRLIASTMYGDTPFSNSETVGVIVNSTSSAPIATAGTGINCTSEKANWQAVAGATYYELDVATDSGFTNKLAGYNALNVGNVLFKDITGLTSGTTYYYRVRAFNGNCISPNSNVITIVVPAVPSAPTGLANGEVRCNHVDLNWNAVSGATSYTVERATDNLFTANLVTVTGLTSTAYTFSGLSMGTNYYFRVRAVNSCGTGANSTAIGAILTLNTPVQPTNVGSNNVLCFQFIVTWTDVAGAADYTVQVATDATFTTGLISFTGVAASPYTVTGLSANTVYYYRVVAVNGCGSGTPVNGSPAFVTTINSVPTVPGNVGASAIGCNLFTMNWTASTAVVDYTVQLSTDSSFSSGVTTVSSITGTTYTFTGLSAGTRYYYRVSARNGCGFSNYGVPSPVFVDTGSLPATPTISVSGSTTICQTEGVTLTSSAASGNVWSTGQTSQSIIATVAGNYTVQVVNSGGCSSAISVPTTVTVEGLPTAIAGGSQTICTNGSATVSGASASNGTIQWSLNTEASGTLTNATTLAPTYTPGLGDSGTTITLTMTVSSNNSCAPIATTATYTVNVEGAPILNDIEISCNATSFVVNSLVPRSGVTDYKIDVSNDNTFSAASLIVTDFSLGDVSPGTTVVNGLNRGETYYFRVRTVTGCGTSVSSIPAIVSVKRTFHNGTSWSPFIPDASMKAVFTGSTLITTPINACSCQINPGVNVVVGVPGDTNGNAVVTIQNRLNIDPTSSLTFENNASLVQINDGVVNVGVITYKRITAPMNNLDYTYWSSPVIGQTLKALVPNTSAYYKFGTTNWVAVPSSTVMGTGNGYIIRSPKPGVYGGAYPETVVMPYKQPVKFVGIPNNGTYTLPINITGQYNLIGNPYPSALSADDFIEENALNNTRVEGTLYFWTHNTPVSSTGYTSADYASYNLSGGVVTANPAINGGVSSLPPSGNIAAGQSFFVASGATAGSVIYNNGMRVQDLASNSQFYRGTKSKTAAIERNRVWLNLTNTGGAFKQLLVGYITGATNGYESIFDGESLDGNTFIDFYSINDNKYLTIQGRALPFDINDQVPLGYRTSIAGTFDITIDHTDGSLSSQPIYVEDKMTNVVHNLKNGPYSFSTAIGRFNDRFVLRYTDKAVDDDTSLGNTTIDAKLKGLVVSVKNHKIKINSFDETINHVMVYDLKGSLIYEKNHLNSNEFTIPNFHSSDQFLIVMTQLTSGKWITKEIVF